MADSEKKKKRRKKDSSTQKKPNSGLRIIDDDELGFYQGPSTDSNDGKKKGGAKQDADLSANNKRWEDLGEMEDEPDELPQIAGVVDERPAELKELERFQENKWKKLSTGIDLNFFEGRRDRSPSTSPPRRKAVADSSPPRRGAQKRSLDSASPPRRSPARRSKVSASPPSPPRRSKGSSTQGKYGLVSPPRRASEALSPPRRSRESSSKHHSGHSSPPRRRTQADTPPRKIKQEPVSPPRRGYGASVSPPRRASRQPASPPRKIKREPVSPPRRINRDSISPPRRPASSASSSDRPRPGAQRVRDSRNRTPSYSPPRRSTDPDQPSSSRALMKRTLDGKLAGIQNASALREEMIDHRRRENAIFEAMSESVSGRGAKTKVRDRHTGKERDFETESKAKLEQQKAEKERLEQYNKWGKGLKQVADQAARVDSALHEMSKPLARYKDDEDLDEHLRNQDRDGDPMLKFLAKSRGKSDKPAYKGPPPLPNRFGIPPGYRWDGVDRSNGYEKDWFGRVNTKKAVEEEAYKWSVEDL